MQTHIHLGERQEGESEKVQATQQNRTPWECNGQNSPMSHFQA